VIIGVR